MRAIDINADLGESFGNWAMGNDEALIPEITSANVACGFHASDPLTMLETVRIAKRNNVAVGAHPGLPDLLGFGRRTMSVSGEDMYGYVVYQVGALQATLAVNGMKLHHVKAHGALYPMLRDSDELAEAVAEALVDLGSPLSYFPAPVATTAIGRALAARGLEVVGEIYPDLGYDDEAGLVLQRSKHHTDAAEAAAMVSRYLADGVVVSQSGKEIAVDAEGICVHGDGPNAAEVANAIRGAVEGAGCKVETRAV
jgi:UPF0271 protein